MSVFNLLMTWHMCGMHGLPCHTLSFTQILLDGPGDLKYSDFGLSRMEGENIEELYHQFSEAGLEEFCNSYDIMNSTLYVPFINFLMPVRTCPCSPVVWAVEGNWYMSTNSPPLPGLLHWTVTRSQLWGPEVGWTSARNKERKKESVS